MSLVNGLSEPESDPDWDAYQEIVWGENTEAAETRRRRYDEGLLSYDSLAEEVIAASVEEEFETVADQIVELRDNWFDFIDYEPSRHEIKDPNKKGMLKHIPDHLGDRYMMDDNIVAFLINGTQMSGEANLNVQERGMFENIGINIDPQSTWNSRKSRFEYQIEYDNGNQGHEIDFLRKAEENDWCLFYREDFFREMARNYEKTVETSGPAKLQLHPLYLKAVKDRLDKVAEPKVIKRDSDIGTDEDVPIANESFREGSIIVTWDSDFSIESHERLKFYKNVVTPDKITRGV